MKAYLLFHINLSFSSIDEDSHKKLIQECYFPILKLSQSKKMKIAIEISAKSLIRIHELDSSFTELLRSLIARNLIELIGSSYTQSIFPIHSAFLNDLNIKWGLDYYKKILSVIPKIALINEMSFSKGIADLYLDNGYQSLIIDIDNINSSEVKNKNSLYKINALNTYKNGIINILWSDSILFQQFQRYIHGENILPEYISLIDKYIKNKVPYIPVYTNDAEVFNFRPGRFQEEKAIDSDEWKKISDLLEYLIHEKGISFLFPSEIIKNAINTQKNIIESISSAEHPVLVKKQPKYNINRWTVTGRGDQELNLKVNRAASMMQKKSLDASNQNIRSLLNFSASDLRTHITDFRWRSHLEEIKHFESNNNICEAELKPYIKTQDDLSLIDFVRSNKLASLKDYKYLCIDTGVINLSLNLFKGMSINTLGFKKHNFNALIRSFNAGSFSGIKHGVDFFSGSLLTELPTDRVRVTDLEKTEPFIKIDNKDEIKLIANFQKKPFSFQKIITLSLVDEKISISYRFDNIKSIIGFIRVGNFALESKYFQDIYVSSLLGSSSREEFLVKKELDHSLPVSNLVSSSSGIPCSDGKISVYCKKNKIGLDFDFDIEKYFAIPMLKHNNLEPNNFFRLIYSLQEFDDTSKGVKKISPLEIVISPT
jgi:hypothetical protein